MVAHPTLWDVVSIAHWSTHAYKKTLYMAIIFAPIGLVHVGLYRAAAVGFSELFTQ